jgi:hypothetical protein
VTIPALDFRTALDHAYGRREGLAPVPSSSAQAADVIAQDTHLCPTCFGQGFTVDDIAELQAEKRAVRDLLESDCEPQMRDRWEE